MIFESLQKTKAFSIEKLKKLDRILAAPLEANLSDFENVPTQFLRQFEKLRNDCLGMLREKNQSSFRQFKKRVLTNVGLIDVRAVDKARHYAQVISLDGNRQQKRQIMLDMIQEDLFHIEFDYEKLNAHEKNCFVVLYFLTESLVLLECGAIKLDHQKTPFEMHKTELFENSLYLNWFCGVFSGQSKMSDAIEVYKVVQRAKDNNQPALAFCHNNPGIVDQLTLSYIDKVLSLSPRFIHKLPAKTHRPLQVLVERARIVALLQIIWAEAFIQHGDKSVNNPPVVELTLPILDKLKIPVIIWHEMLQLNAAKPEADRFIHPIGGERYRLGNLSLDQIMSQYCGTALKGFYDLVGKWFEEEYAIDYISSEVSQNHYKVFKGFKAGNGVKPNYDVDFIIEDVEAERLLFCQLKYRQTSRLPFFRSEWREFFLGNQISHGIKQLQGLKESFDDPIVLQQVRQRTGRKNLDANFLKNHTSLVLIHNIENFDFCSYEGVILYEWNTFRNLLKRYSVKKSKNQKETEKVYPGRVPLEDIQATIRYLVEHGLSDPNMIDLEREWALFNSAHVLLEWCKRPFGHFFPWWKERARVAYPLI